MIFANARLVVRDPHHAMCTALQGSLQTFDTKPALILVPPLQALPVKLLALGAFTGVVNLPSGVARVHVEKFSPGWFVAVSLDLQQHAGAYTTTGF